MPPRPGPRPANGGSQRVSPAAPAGTERGTAEGTPIPARPLGPRPGLPSRPGPATCSPGAASSSREQSSAHCRNFLRLKQLQARSSGSMSGPIPPLGRAGAEQEGEPSCGYENGRLRLGPPGLRAAMATCGGVLSAPVSPSRGYPKNWGVI